MQEKFTKKGFIDLETLRDYKTNLKETLKQSLDNIDIIDFKDIKENPNLKNVQKMVSQNPFIYTNPLLIEKESKFQKKFSLTCENKNLEFFSPKNFPSKNILPILFALSNDKLLPAIWIEKKGKIFILTLGLKDETLLNSSSFLKIIKFGIYQAKNHFFKKNSSTKSVKKLPFLVNKKEIVFTAKNELNLQLPQNENQQVYSKTGYGEFFLYRNKLYLKSPPYLLISNMEFSSKNRTIKFARHKNNIIGFEKNSKNLLFLLKPYYKDNLFELITLGEDDITVSLSVPLRKLIPYYFEKNELNYFIDKDSKLMYISRDDGKAMILLVTSKQPITSFHSIDNKNTKLNITIKLQKNTAIKIVFFTDNFNKKYSSSILKKPLKLSKKKSSCSDIIKLSTQLTLCYKKSRKINYGENFFRLFNPNIEEKFSSHGFDILEKNTISKTIKEFVWSTPETLIKKIASELNDYTIGDTIYPSGSGGVSWKDESEIAELILKEHDEKLNRLTIVSNEDHIKERERAKLLFAFKGKEFFFNSLNSSSSLILDVIGLRIYKDEILISPIIYPNLKKLCIKNIYVENFSFNLCIINRKTEAIIKIKRLKGNYKIRFLNLYNYKIKKEKLKNSNETVFYLDKNKSIEISSDKFDVYNFIKSCQFDNEKLRLKLEINKKSSPPFQVEMHLNSLNIKKISGARVKTLNSKKKLILIDPERVKNVYIYFYSDELKTLFSNRTKH